jgi:hypothetical protein
MMIHQSPALIESAGSAKQFHKNWARLIQKIYNVDPLLCPKCQATMRIISFIEDECVIEKILRHLGLWLTRNHDPTFKNAAHIPELTYGDFYSQLPPVDYWL